MIGRVVDRATRDRDVQRRLRRAALRPLPLATRLLLVKADGSVLVHSLVARTSREPDVAALRLAEVEPDDAEAAEGVSARGPSSTRGWGNASTPKSTRSTTTAPTISASTPADQDGVEADLQGLLAEHITTLGDGYTLDRREYPTPIGPVDTPSRPHRRDGRGRDQASRGDRRCRAADP